MTRWQLWKARIAVRLHLRHVHTEECGVLD